MADTTLPGVLLKGVAASRPAANAVAKGTIYSATDTGAITQSDASSWSTYATISSGMTDPMTTRGDIIIRNSSNTTARLGRGSSGQVLTSDGTDVAWATPASSGRAFGLDRASLNGTYGDEFDGASLNARWTRHNQTSGQETYQSGGFGSALRVAHGTVNAAEYIYQTAPNGTNETWEASVSWYQETTTLQMFALLMVDSSGNGVAALVYDNTNGLYLANVASHTYSSALATNTALHPDAVYYQGGGRIWLKLRKASGLYGASYSIDGQDWSRELTATPSAFTPARVGIGRILGTNANSIGVWHWFDKTA